MGPPEMSARPFFVANSRGPAPLVTGDFPSSRFPAINTASREQRSCEMGPWKIATIGLLATATAVPVSAGQASSSMPVFAATTIDYGTIPWGGNGVRVFTFVNRGTRPFKILALADCGCLVPLYPKGWIMPGASATISVSYDTKRAGAFARTITVTATPASASPVILTVKGVVAAPPVAPTNPFPNP